MSQVATVTAKELIKSLQDSMATHGDDLLVIVNGKRSSDSKSGKIYSMIGYDTVDLSRFTGPDGTQLLDKHAFVMGCVEAF